LTRRPISDQLFKCAFNSALRIVVRKTSVLHCGNVDSPASGLPLGKCTM